MPFDGLTLYVYDVKSLHMKHLLSFFLLCSIAIAFSSATQQKEQQVFLKLIDASGQTIRGTSVQRGYERQIEVTNFSGYTTGNSQLKFTMPSGSATAALANVQGSKQQLPSALFTITQIGEVTINITSTVRLEEVTVLSVSDVNGSTEVTLKASRIGVTYFQMNRRTGVQTVSSKTGFDFANKQPWTSF
jgi:type VI protein secretion system component Hcp